MTLLGLKKGQGLGNRAAQPHQEFPGVPPRERNLEVLGEESRLVLQTPTLTHFATHFIQETIFHDPVSCYFSLRNTLFIITYFILFYSLTDIRELISSQRAANVRNSFTASGSEIYPVQDPH